MRNSTNLITYMIVIFLFSILFFSSITRAQNLDTLFDQAEAQHNRGNDRQACALLEQAAQQGHRDSQFMTGVCYEYGYGGIQDFRKAAYWYQQAVNQNDYEAMTNLGALVAQGKGVQQNCQKAEQLFLQATDYVPMALFNLGLMHQSGCGSIGANTRKAVDYYERAAKRGNFNSQVNLAYVYANGIGRQQDMSNACYWAAVAIRYGNNPSARQNVELYCSHVSQNQAQNIKQQAARFSPIASLAIPDVNPTASVPQRQVSVNKQQIQAKKMPSGHRWKKPVK